VTDYPDAPDHDQPDDEQQLGNDMAGNHLPPRPDVHAMSSQVLGVQVINWRTLPDDKAREAWEALRGWVEWFTVRYDIPLSTVPDCWYKHPALVEELSALRAAHTVSFDSRDTGLGPVGFHERLSLALPRLTKAYAGGCARGHSTHTPRSWSNATDEQEWDAWTKSAHAHRDTPPGDSPSKGARP
jgi:hypothetical protein